MNIIVNGNGIVTQWSPSGSPTPPAGSSLVSLDESQEAAFSQALNTKNGGITFINSEIGTLPYVPPAPPTSSQIIDIHLPQSGTARVLFEAIFEIVNDVRALKGQGSITRAQLKNWLENKLP